MKPKYLINVLAAGILLVLFNGCDDEEKYQLKFSHYIHVTDNEMDCDECHGELGEPSFLSMSHETCVDCHDEAEEQEFSRDTCGYCHQEKQLSLLADWQAQPAETNQAVFVHTEALAGTCQECHGSIMAEGLVIVPELKRNDIVQIRDDAHSSGQDCLACHVDMDRNQEPPSHDLYWTKRHGLFGMQDDASCSVCHTEDSCTECHSVMQPRNHNNLWRHRAHGVEASWNREGCIVCHQEDSCQVCHAETRPRSHQGRWDSPGKKPTHCIGCHTAATAGEGCVVCHEEGNDLLLHERFWPSGPGAMPDHNLLGAAVSCYECHWLNTP